MSEDRDRKAVNAKHFELLKTFGRSAQAESLDEEQQETLWKIACQSGRLPVVPREIVVEEWKKMITANSRRTKVVMSGEADKNYISIGIAFDGLIVAGHTTTVRGLVKKIAKIVRSTVDSDAECTDLILRMIRDELTSGTKNKRQK